MNSTPVGAPRSSSDFADAVVSAGVDAPIN